MTNDLPEITHSKPMNNKIYLDYAATTPVDPLVVKATQPYFTEKFGNTMSLYSFGQEASEVLEKSRQFFADELNAKMREIYFTSSATESNNWALKGLALANREKKHIVVSAIEHDCVLNTAKWLAKNDWEITYLPVDKFGLVEPKDVEKAIKKNTLLVSVMHANNEIGTLEPIEAIGKICHAYRQAGHDREVYFHTDAAQTFGKLPIDVKKMNIDLLTVSSHKIYGPKGAALLYVREGIKIEPLLHGGAHEFWKRASTVNVPAIVGFAKAAEIARKEKDMESARLTKLRDKLIKETIKKIPDTYLVGHPTKRLANNVNLRFSYVEGESIIMMLDSLGIAASTGSACSSPDLHASHVALACGLRPQEAHGTLRFTLGRWTTEKEIDYVLEILPGIIKKLREISPFK